MASTLAAFAVLQIVMPTVIREHLQAPVTEQVAFSSAGVHDLLTNAQGNLMLPGYTVAGAWVLTPEPALLDAAGNPVTRAVTAECLSGGGTTGEREKAMSCLEAKNMHVDLSYQPADRYWTFQWLEFAVYLALAALLAAFAFWRIPRGMS